MMSDLRVRARARRKSLVVESLSCIPMLLNETRPDLYAVQVFQSELRRNPLYTKVIIVEPYMDSQSFLYLSELFGGVNNLEIEILSKFRSVDKDTKEERKQELSNLSSELTRNGLFKSVALKHSSSPMHDRYFVLCKDNEVIEKILFIGGSLGQRFGDYICINKLSDSYMIRSVERYINILKSDSCEV